MLQIHFKDNAHRVTVILRPDEKEASRLQKDESDRLKAVRSQMNSDEFSRTVRDAELLRISQEKPDSPEDIAKLPCLGLKDLEPNISTIPSEEINVNGTRLLFHDIFHHEIL